MNAYKTGRLPATRPAVLKDLALYATGVLPRPPAKVAMPNIDLPMDGNDKYGDCTMAGIDHVVRVCEHQFGGDIPLPTEAKIVAKYLELSPNDEGLNESELLARWLKPGVGLNLGYGQPVAYVPVPPKDAFQVMQSIAFYGTCYFGGMVGQPQQEQFSSGEPWKWVDGQEEDGHCWVGVGYDEGGVYSATWGGIAYQPWGFLAHSLDEAWCILTHQLVEVKADTLGIDIATLKADLARV
jgi:hypothetical protein